MTEENDISEQTRAFEPAQEPETEPAAEAETENPSAEAEPDAEETTVAGEAESGETSTAKRGRREKKKKEQQKTDAFDWVQCVVTALVVCILLFIFVGRTVGVVGSSMESTLSQGDRLIISRLFYTPQQGDIVVLCKNTFKEEAIIKRVIAVGGQTVDIDFDEGIVYVDGEALEEDYINELTYRPLDFDGEITVPEGSVFVLGDNRNHSNDSRDSRIGCVDARYIIGKAYWRVTPFSDFGSVYD